MYHVVFSREAIKELSKLDKQMTKLIFAWIHKNLEGTLNPFQHGKPLTGEFKGSWRYRVGEYRILAVVEEDKLAILVVTIGHKKTFIMNNNTTPLDFRIFNL